MHRYIKQLGQCQIFNLPYVHILYNIILIFTLLKDIFCLTFLLDSDSDKEFKVFTIIIVKKIFNASVWVIGTILGVILLIYRIFKFLNK